MHQQTSIMNLIETIQAKMEAICLQLDANSDDDNRNFRDRRYSQDIGRENGLQPRRGRGRGFQKKRQGSNIATPMATVPTQAMSVRLLVQTIRIIQHL